MPDSGPVPSLRGRRILIVEDDMLVFMLLEELLLDLGCTFLGPATHLAKAAELAGSETMDGAILDLNVGGREVYPVADKLAERRIPFAFVTGYSAGHVSERYRDRPVLRKPFKLDDLARTIESLVGETAR